ncbi:MAG: organomercurial lyase [Actinomycetota bacterium]
MKTESDRLESLATAVATAAPDFEERIALEVYRRLAQGSPAPASDVAERAGAPVERVEELLASWPGVYLDEAKNVIGFWGLTITKLSPTHRLEVNGRNLFAWCAWDTLFLPGILDATARVESACPMTGEMISLVVSPGGVVESSHPGAVVSFLTPERDFDGDVIQSFCHFVHFFASRKAGGAWTAEHPGTFLLSLDDAFELGRRVNALNFPSVLGGGR